jgi:TatD DNase family protein
MIQPNYFDTHSHIHFPQFDADRADVIERMQHAGVWTVLVATNDATSRSAIALAEKYSFMFATIGVHPTEFETFTKTHYEALAKKTKVVAIGECGLDYFRKDIANEYITEPKRQQDLFESQIRFALEHEKPLMMHIRPSSGSTNAHDDALAILERYSKEYGEKLRGTAHFFTSTPEMAKRYIELGFHISIPGVITFDKDLEETVRYAPIERILSETDSPYAAPEPHRGKRNEPVYVQQVVHAVARIKKMTDEKTRMQLFVNAARLFGVTL